MSGPLPGNVKVMCTEHMIKIPEEVGGGAGWGIHVNPWLIHFNV